MTRYHVDKPPHGRDVMPARTPTGPAVITPGAPTVPLHQDFTPIPVDPPTVQQPDGSVHLDQDETLRLLYKNAVRTSRGIDSTQAGLVIDLDAIEKKFARASKFSGVIIGLLSIVGTIFAVGVAFAALRDSIATHDDVNNAIIQHNEVDPSTRDPETLQEVGSHPVFRRRIDEANNAIKSNAADIEKMKNAQRKIDMRNEYQFEFARWQAKVTECERTKRCKPPARPARLDELERVLMLGGEP